MTIGELNVYSGVFEGIDRKVLMDAANSIAEKSSSMCAFAIDEDKLTLIVSANPDLGIDCTTVLNDVLKRVSGRGGAAALSPPEGTRPRSGVPFGR